MTPSDKAQRLKQLSAELASIQSAIDALKHLPTHTYCADCLHSDRHSFYCSQWADVVPPEYRQQNDCPQFEDDIPF
ncbi:MAG: hypothetical protein WAT29_13990 [Thiolinea sp.]